MKPVTQSVAISLCVVFISALSCKSAPTSEEEKVKSMLKTFYANYVRMNSGVDSDKTDSLMNKYCTAKLIRYANNLYSEPPSKINSDLFLQTQMIDVRILENLRIQKDLKADNVYYVSYTYGSNSPIIVKLSVIKERDVYKIDHVFISEVGR